MVDSTAEEACTLACDDVLEWYWEGIYQGVRKESFGTKVCDIKLNHFRNISGVTMVFFGKISIVIPLLLSKNDKTIIQFSRACKSLCATVCRI